MSFLDSYLSLQDYYIFFYYCFGFDSSEKNFFFFCYNVGSHLSFSHDNYLGISTIILSLTDLKCHSYYILDS